MIDLMQLIAGGRKVADDFAKADYRAAAKDALAELQAIEADVEQVFPAPPAVDPNGPPPLSAHMPATLSASGWPTAVQLAAKFNAVCDDHEAQAKKVGATAGAAGQHPILQSLIKNLLPLLIQALQFLPAAA